MTERKFDHIMNKSGVLDEVIYLIYSNIQKQKELLKAADQFLIELESDANSGNEAIYKSYSELKELVLKLNEMGKIK